MSKGYLWSSVVLSLALVLGGCTAVEKTSRGVGKATGKAVKTVKDIPAEVEKGYRQGRAEEDPAQR